MAVRRIYLMHDNLPKNALRQRSTEGMRMKDLDDKQWLRQEEEIDGSREEEKQ